jgi:hypothetical protein
MYKSRSPNSSYFRDKSQISDYFHKRIKKIVHFPSNKPMNFFSSNTVLRAKGLNVSKPAKVINKSSSQMESQINSSRIQFSAAESDTPSGSLIISRIKSKSPELSSPYSTSKEGEIILKLQAKPSLSVFPPLTIHRASMKVFKRKLTPL